MKDVILDLYLNSSKMLQKLIYYKEPIEKDKNRVTVENIINLRIINKNKKKKKKMIMKMKIKHKMKVHLIKLIIIIVKVIEIIQILKKI